VFQRDRELINASGSANERALQASERTLQHFLEQRRRLNIEIE
jgi:hypothetical protein